MDDDLKTRYVGTCPVCEQLHKLKTRNSRASTLVLVHHGYRRPGTGSIHGDCFGVGYEPYEISPLGCEEFRRHAQNVIESTQEQLHRLESGDVHELHVMSWGVGGKKMVTLTDSGDEVDRYRFKRELENKIQSTKHSIESWQEQVKRMDRLIADWRLKPVVTFEEHADRVNAEKRAASEERRRLLDEKRSVKREKAATLSQKRAEREAEREALIQKYREIFQGLADDRSDLRARKVSAWQHWRDMFKAKRRKGYLHFYPSELQNTSALLELGLAKHGVRGVEYATEYSGP